MDANSNSSRVTVTVFVSENVKNIITEPLVTQFNKILSFSYSTHLNTTLEIQTTEITSGNTDKGDVDITVFAMYSITATGKSKNSTALKLAGGLTVHSTLSS